MPQLHCNGIDLEYEEDGPPDGAPLLLIAGLGSQLTRWPPELCTGLGEGGFRVIRFDNRDAGLSTHMHGAPVPDLVAVTAAKRRGETQVLPYTMSDLAADAAGLLDGLRIAAAHVLGVSFGGMIAQVLAIEHPHRVLSLAMMMTQSGNPEMPAADPSLIAILGGTPPDPVQDHEGHLRHAVAFLRALEGPGHAASDAELRTFAARTAARAYDPAGQGRQLAAARAAPDRRAALRALSVPTLVIHGADDRLMPPVCGEDIARQIANSWLLIVNGMGHDLPPLLFGLFVSLLKSNSIRANA